MKKVVALLGFLLVICPASTFANDSESKDVPISTGKDKPSRGGSGTDRAMNRNLKQVRNLAEKIQKNPTSKRNEGLAGKIVRIVDSMMA